MGKNDEGNTSKCPGRPGWTKSTDCGKAGFPQVSTPPPTGPNSARSRRPQATGRPSRMALAAEARTRGPGAPGAPRAPRPRVGEAPKLIAPPDRGIFTTRYPRPAERRSAPPLPGPDSGGAARPPDPEPVRAILTMLAAFGEKEEGPPDSAQV